MSVGRMLHLTKTCACIKGIVSRDFEVCFLVLFNSSDIATPTGTGSFFFVFFKSISCWIFDFSGLGASSFCSVRISAQCTSRAHFVAPDSVRQRIWCKLDFSVITNIALTVCDRGSRWNFGSFVRDCPGLYEPRKVCRLGYHSLSGAQFDDVIVFQPGSAVW
jgi:hypothetical protein